MSSSLGYQPSSFQCLITLDNISFECTDSEFSVKSELATSYQQCHNEDISSKIHVPEQVLEKPERDTEGTLLHFLLLKVLAPGMVAYSVRVPFGPPIV